jgi:HSP20 family protein
MKLTARRETAPVRGRYADPFDVVSDLLRWDPFREMSALASRPEYAFVPAFEVKETKDAYVFKGDVPGVKEDDVEISLTGNRLTISGHRKEEKREETDQYHAYERSYGSFSRSFTLPEGIDNEHVNAELTEGVLTVSVPKTPEVQPKKISIGAQGRTPANKA